MRTGPNGHFSILSAPTADPHSAIGDAENCDPIIYFLLALAQSGGFGGLGELSATRGFDNHSNSIKLNSTILVFSKSRYR